jgi:hypothetical protein
MFTYFQLCFTKYTSYCLLLDMCKMIDRLSAAHDLQILPGVFIVSNKSEHQIPIDTCEEAALLKQFEKLHVHVRQKLQAYMDSLSINWKIMDRNSVFSVRQLGDDLITELLPSTTIGKFYSDPHARLRMIPNF